jgi:hypothetical protein
MIKIFQNRSQKYKKKGSGYKVQGSGLKGISKLAN